MGMTASDAQMLALASPQPPNPKPETTLKPETQMFFKAGPMKDTTLNPKPFASEILRNTTPVRALEG